MWYMVLILFKNNGIPNKNLETLKEKSLCFRPALTFSEIASLMGNEPLGNWKNCVIQDLYTR